MSKRFGKKRVPGCQCTYNFTCGACLANAPIYVPFESKQPPLRLVNAHEVLPGDTFRDYSVK